MALLLVPQMDAEPWPTLGAEICDFIEDVAVYGPGSLQGQPYVIDPQFRMFLYRAFEVYPKGHEWAGRRRFKRVGMSVRKGLAKCLAFETPVLMADGSTIRADAVRVGDRVVSYSDDRNLVSATVVAAEVQPVAPLWRVTTERGRVLTVTGDHPVMVRGTRMLPGVPRRRRYASCDPGRDVERWVKASDLIVGDRVVIGLGWQGVGELSADTAWILGAIMGDGCGDGRFASADPEVIDRLGSRFDVTKCSGDQYGYYLRGSRDLLREFGLIGCNSRSKRVPNAVTVANRDAVVAFLAGYFDTDGYAVYEPRPNGKIHANISWSSVNREVLEACQTLLAGLGINATLVHKMATYKGAPHDSWAVEVRDTVQAATLSGLLLTECVRPKHHETLRLIADREVGRVFAHRDTDKVIRVERLEPAQTIGLEISGNHTHVTSGIVTHNTEMMAVIALCELHPEGPTRCDGFDSSGNPVGRPVNSPYIPMLAVTAEQVEELAFGALKYIIENGPDVDLFDSQKEIIHRLDLRGRSDGVARALSNSPGARDGARTTLNCFDEPHRLYLPRQKDAHTTMDANLPKRPKDDPWSLYVGTAGELGQESVAEELHQEAEAIRDGLIERADLFYLYRTDDKPDRDLTSKNERIKAVAEATGPAGEWGPGQFDEIASKWDRPGADGPYLERVWLNRWVKAGAQAFDIGKWETLASDELIPDGAPVVAGFDGARFRDSTGIVLTEVATGRQCLWAGWERPLDWPDHEEAPQWEIDEAEVSAAIDALHERFTVVRAYADPPHWTSTIGEWAGKYGVWQEWWTNSVKRMSYAVRAYADAQQTGAVSHERGRNASHERDFARHIGNAGRVNTQLFDDDGKQMFVLGKIHPDRKFDYAMAGCLSWRAYLDQLSKPVKPPVEKKTYKIKKLR